MGRIEDAIRKLEKTRETGSSRAGGRIGGRIDEAAGVATSFSLAGCGDRIAVDMQRLGRWGPIIRGGDDEGAGAEYAAIKQPVIDLALGRRAGDVRDANLVMVTSALAGEGKSLISLNLALSIARERDLSVLLVDGDVGRGTISGFLSSREALGLTDLIDDPELSLEQIVHSSSIRDFYFLPVGQKRSGALELLSSRRMEGIMKALASSSGNLITIVDSPPMLMTAEARQLAALAGQVVFVVKAWETRRADVSEALELFDPEKPVNLVLNGADSSDVTFHGGDYGGYAEDSVDRAAADDKALN